MAGADGDPVHGERPVADTTRAVWSSRPALEPAITISRSHCDRRRLTAAAIRGGESGSIGRIHASHPASRACAASISEFVSRISAAPGSVPIGTISSRVGRTRTTGSLPDGKLLHAGRDRRGQVGGTQPVAFREQQLAGADVLADGADVLVRRGSGEQFGPAFGVVVDVLAHHDRVRPSGIGSPVSITS